MLHGVSQLIKDITRWIPSVYKDIAPWSQSVDKEYCSIDSDEKGQCSVE